MSVPTSNKTDFDNLDLLVPNRLGAIARPTETERSKDADTISSDSYESGIDDLYVIRESAEYDLYVLSHMIEQTLLPRAGNPDCARALALGTSPITDSEVQQRLHVRFLDYHMREFTPGVGRQRRVCAYVFEIGRSAFVYAMSSAGTSNSINDDNAITSIVCKVLRGYRPGRLIANAITRLLRSTKYGATLEATIQELGVRVSTNEIAMELDLSDTNDNVQWSLMKAMAAWERDQIVYRTRVARALYLKDGAYPFSGAGAPTGYMKGQDGRLHVTDDPEEIELVRQIIQLLAAGEDLRGITSHLLTLDVRTRGLRKRHENSTTNVTLKKAAAPIAIVRGVIKWIPMLRDGEYRCKLRVPVKRNDKEHEFAGMKVQFDAKGAYVVGRLPLEEPKGGWASPSQLEHAVHRATELWDTVSDRANSDRKGQHHLLTGIVVRQTNEESWYLTGQDRYYKIARKRRGEKKKTVAFVEVKELHTRIATGLRAALVDQGIEADPLLLEIIREAADPGVVRDKHRCKEIEKDLRTLKVRKKGAMESVAFYLGEEKPEEAAEYRDIAEDCSATIAREREELEGIEQRLACPVTPPAELDSAAEVLAGALRLLELCPEHPSQDVLDAFGMILTKLTFSEEPAWMRWSIYVRVQTIYGPIEFGPVTGTVPYVRRKGDLVHAAARDAQWLEEMMSKGLSVAALASELTLTATPVRRRLLQQLENSVPTHEARTALLDNPTPESRQALWARHIGGPLPEGMTDAYADWIYTIYTDPAFVWGHRESPGDAELRREITTLLKGTDNGWRSRQEVSERVERVTRGCFSSFARALPTSTRTGVKALPPSFQLVEREGVPGVSLFRCRCGSLVSHVLFLPEVTDGLLCETCMEMPFDVSSPIFPPGYFTVPGTYFRRRGARSA